MSVMIVQILPQGIILAADRNITSMRLGAGVGGSQIIVVLGQSQRPKVLRWPNRKALIGYVGAARIGDIPSDEWLYDHIGNHLDISNFEQLANDLTNSVQRQRSLDEGNNEPEHLIIHLAGFEQREGHMVPVVYYIRNHHAVIENKPGEYYTDIRKEFICTEEFWGYFSGVSPEHIRRQLEERVNNNQPFWFHQGYDLSIFNTLDVFLQGAFTLLHQVHPAHPSPQTLSEWEQYLKMSILTYGAYFQAFKGPGEQYVGGGADTVSLKWP